MRRALILLALLLAGLARGAAGDASATGGRHEIVSTAVVEAAGLSRSASAALSRVPHDGSGSASRASLPRADLPGTGSAQAVRLAAREAAFGFRSTLHRRYGASLALARAGLLSFHTDTPPPFRLL